MGVPSSNVPICWDTPVASVHVAPEAAGHDAPAVATQETFNVVPVFPDEAAVPRTTTSLPTDPLSVVTNGVEESVPVTETAPPTSPVAAATLGAFSAATTGDPAEHTR